MSAERQSILYVQNERRTKREITASAEAAAHLSVQGACTARASSRRTLEAWQIRSTNSRSTSASFLLAATTRRGGFRIATPSATQAGNSCDSFPLSLAPTKGAPRPSGALLCQASMVSPKIEGQGTGRFWQQRRAVPAINSFTSEEQREPHIHKAFARPVPSEHHKTSLLKCKPGEALDE